jgi:hypothetical protein
VTLTKSCLVPWGGEKGYRVESCAKKGCGAMQG